MIKGGYVYIVSNPERTVLHIAVTEDLQARICALKTGEAVPFSRNHQCTELLYYEYYEDIADASLRAEQLKKWSRARKDELLRFNNPELKDLNDSVGGKG